MRQSEPRLTGGATFLSGTVVAVFMREKVEESGAIR